MPDPEATPHAPLSRRTFMLSTAATAATPLAAGVSTGAQAQTPAARPAALAPVSPGLATVLPMTLRVNGSDHALNLDPRTALLDALREHHERQPG